MTEESRHVVRIDRSFRAPAVDVFDAWTNPEVLRRWYRCGSEWTTPEVEVDPRVGGAIRVRMRGPDGTECGARGTFTLIDRPHWLMMTWTFDREPSNEQLLVLSFSESAGVTTVVLINSRIAREERRDLQDAGWHACLGQLGRVLSARAVGEAPRRVDGADRLRV